MKIYALILALAVAGCAEAGVASPGAPGIVADTPAPTDEASEPATEEPSVEAPPEDTPEPTPDAPTRFKPGETITITENDENWATVRVDRVKQVRKYNGPYDLDDVPKKGNVYIELRVTYVAIVDGVDYNPFDWQVFVGGEAADDYTYVSNGPTPQLNSGTLPKGRKASGYLVYEVGAKGEVLFSYKGSAFSNEAPVFEVVLRAK